MLQIDTVASTHVAHVPSQVSCASAGCLMLHVGEQERRNMVLFTPFFVWPKVNKDLHRTVEARQIASGVHSVSIG